MYPTSTLLCKRWSSIWTFNFKYIHSDFKSSSYVHQGIYTWVESPSKIERKKTQTLHSEKLELSWHSFSYHYNVQQYGFHSVWVFSLTLPSKVACTCSNQCTMTSDIRVQFDVFWCTLIYLERLNCYKYKRSLKVPILAYSTMVLYVFVERRYWLTGSNQPPRCILWIYRCRKICIAQLLQVLLKLTANLITTLLWAHLVLLLSNNLKRIRWTIKEAHLVRQRDKEPLLATR